MDDDDDDFFGAMLMPPAPQSRRFMRTDLAVLALDLVQGVAASVASTLMDARNIAAMHSNWECDRDRFHEQAALEIETLIAGDVDHE